VTISPLAKKEDLPIPSRPIIQKAVAPPYRVFVLSLTALCFCATVPASTAVDSPFPPSVTCEVDGQAITLDQTGWAKRYFFLFQVYRMAHYAPSDFQGEALSSEAAPKRISMVFSRDVGGARLRSDFRKSLKQRVSEEEWQALAPAVAAFCAPITSGVERGDRFTLDWLPDGAIESRFNGKTLCRVEDPRFARALWSIWFGPDSVVNRDDLLGDASS